MQKNGQQKKVLLIKFGGSIITDKNVEQSVNDAVLRSLVRQLAEIRRRRPDLHIILAHGQGSFAHFPVKKYRLHEGFVDPNAQFGCAIALDIVAKLNRIVITECLAQQLPAVSLFPSQVAVADDGKPHSAYLDTLEEYLRLGLLPVLTGDVITDKKNGSVIWSADFLLPYYARRLRELGWDVETLVHVTKTPGVYKDIEKPELGIFETITPDSFTKISGQLGKSHGTDVTGGMLEKVRQAVELAQDGIETVIISNEAQNLLSLVCENKKVGTRVL